MIKCLPSCASFCDAMQKEGAGNYPYGFGTRTVAGKARIQKYGARCIHRVLCSFTWSGLGPAKACHASLPVLPRAPLQGGPRS